MASVAVAGLRLADPGIREYQFRPAKYRFRPAEHDVCHGGEPMNSRCERCERAFDAHTGTDRARHEAGRLNGWSAGGPTLCPSCASAGGVWSTRNAWNPDSRDGV